MSKVSQSDKKIRSTKHEIRNKFEIQISNVKNQEFRGFLPYSSTIIAPGPLLYAPYIQHPVSNLNV